MKFFSPEGLTYKLRHFGWVMRHPLNKAQPIKTLGRYLGWHLGSRLLGQPVIYPFVNDLVMQVGTGMWGATGIVHFGLEEYADMAFAAHLLRPGDLFVDVGACYGTYSLLAAGVGGADVMAFEPNPDTAKKLQENLRLNRLEALAQVQVAAVGAARGSLRMTQHLRAANHVLAAEDGGSTEPGVAVAVTTLDAELAAANPTLIKIDVEGYEQAVLAGGRKTLAGESLLAVIMEDANLGKRYQARSNQHQQMLAAGFGSYRYCPERRALQDLGGEPNRGELNTLYVKNLALVQARLASAKPFSIRGHVL